MSHKAAMWILGVVISVTFFFSGCAKKLEFSQDSIHAYRIVRDSAKGKEQKVGDIEEMAFIQRIDAVDEKGDATATITIKQIEYWSRSKQGDVYEYDSSLPKNSGNPLTRLIGKSYKIKITTAGKVSVVDTQNVSGLITEGREQVIAEAIISDKAIKARHKVVFWPAEKREGLSEELPYAYPKLSFVQGDVHTYKITMRMIKDFRFEQPSLTPPKLKEEQSGTTVDITFEQKIDNIQSDGTALATVTVKEIAYTLKDKGTLEFDFDSARQADKGKPFAKAIGQSYTIKISPAGVAEVVDAKDVRKAVVAGYEAKVARALFGDDRIKKRHSILALPDIDKSPLIPGEFWSRIVGSPPGLLAPKSFEKTYTLESIEGSNGNQVVTVLMNAAESAESAPDTVKQPAGMSIFANMFDASETYTGKMVLELGTGKILQYNEELVVTYLAAEEPRGGSGGKGPDTLTMRLTQSVNMEIVE